MFGREASWIIILTVVVTIFILMTGCTEGDYVGTWNLYTGDPSSPNEGGNLYIYPGGTWKAVSQPPVETLTGYWTEIAPNYIKLTITDVPNVPPSELFCYLLEYQPEKSRFYMHNIMGKNRCFYRTKNDYSLYTLKSQFPIP